MTTPEILPPRKAPPPPTSAVPSLPNSAGFNPSHNSGSNTSISSSSRSRSVDHNSSSNIFMENSMLELYTEIVPEKSQAVIREENLDYTVHTHHESIPSSKTGTLNNLEMLLKSGNNTPVMNSKKASPDLDQEATIENLRNKIRDLERRLTVGSNSESLLLNNLQFQLQKSREVGSFITSFYSANSSVIGVQSLGVKISWLGKGTTFRVQGWEEQRYGDFVGNSSISHQTNRRTSNGKRFYGNAA